jgi:hypothetical protein
MPDDDSLKEYDPSLDALANRISGAIGMILAELPKRKRGVWYRFRFDVVELASGTRVNHVRIEEIPEQDIFAR